MALSKLFTRGAQTGLARYGGSALRNRCTAFIQTRTAVNKIEETADFENYVNTSVKLLVIDYKAEWCGPCKRMAPIFEELSNQYDDKVDFLSVDCDDLPELAAQRGVASLPTFELIKNGKALEQVIGANPSKLEQAIVRYLDE